METKHTSSGLERDVLRLRRAGKGPREIASLLGVPLHRVAVVSARLYRDGRVAHGRSCALRDKELEAKICRLRRLGKLNDEIAQLLEVSPSLVSRLAAVLIRQGRIPDGRAGGPDAAGRRRRRDAIIVKMTEQGETLTAIGKRLGLTRQRVLQLRGAIENKHGPSGAAIS